MGKQLFVHRLVADAFIRELGDPKKEIVNHKNGIQTDNRLESLEICYVSANARHSMALRSKISRFEDVLIPVKNSSFEDLFISSSNATENDDALTEFLESKNFQCIKCKDRRRFNVMIEDYLNS